MARSRPAPQQVCASTPGCISNGKATPSEGLKESQRATFCDGAAGSEPEAEGPWATVLSWSVVHGSQCHVQDSSGHLGQRAPCHLPESGEQSVQHPGPLGFIHIQSLGAARKQEGHDHRRVTAGGVAVSQACARPHGNGGCCTPPCGPITDVTDELDRTKQDGAEAQSHASGGASRAGLAACTLLGGLTAWTTVPHPVPSGHVLPQLLHLAGVQRAWGLSPWEALRLHPGEQAGAGPVWSPRPSLLRAFRVGVTGP